MNKLNVSLESDVADIEMVSRLHAIISSYFEVSSENDYYFYKDGNYNDFKDYITKSLHVSPITDQLNELMKKPAINKIFGFYLTDEDITPNTVNVFYMRNNYTGVADVCNLIYSYDGYELHVIYDSKTDKIVEIKVYDYRKKRQKVTSNQRRQAVKAMLEYLNLEIVGDFKCKDNKYSSEKAHITIACEYGDDNYLKLFPAVDDKYEISTYDGSGTNSQIYNDNKEKSEAESFLLQ